MSKQPPYVIIEYNNGVRSKSEVCCVDYGFILYYEYTLYNTHQNYKSITIYDSNNELKSIDITSTSVKYLNIIGGKNIKYIFCANTNIRELDLSMCTTLNYIWCDIELENKIKTSNECIIYHI